MSATDVVAASSGPSLDEVNKPVLDDRPRSISPFEGESETSAKNSRKSSAKSSPEITSRPDGRTSTEPQKDVPSIKTEEVEANTSTTEAPQSPVQETPAEIKVDIKTDRSGSAVVIKEGSDTHRSVEFVENSDKIVPEHADDKEAMKVNTKVTEFKFPDTNGKNDKDTGNKSDQDNAKQSKATGNGKKGVSEHSDGNKTIPMTESSETDGNKHVSIDNEKERKEGRAETDRESARTPFSVRVERKPLHTAQTRSHSDYYSKTPSSSRYAHIASSLGQFYGFGTDPLKDHRFTAQMTRMRRPPKLVRLATVTMSPKTKPIQRGPSLYYEEPKKPQKVITWDEANDARPPLRIDMEGPGPTQYSPRNRPLNETNSPAWTFGSRCFTEKAGGGSRTSWEKTWFQNPEVWTSKVDFYNDSAWPTPVHYKARPMLGPRQRTTVEAPSFTIGTRKEMTLSKMGSDKEPSPGDYDKDLADSLVMKKAPSFSHQFRREGTVIWPTKDRGPGPGSYNPNYTFNKPHGPKYSIRSIRREKSHSLGPFSTF